MVETLRERERERLEVVLWMERDWFGGTHRVSSSRVVGTHIGLGAGVHHIEGALYIEGILGRAEIWSKNRK